MTANEHNTDRNLDKYSIKRTLEKRDILKYPQTTQTFTIFTRTTKLLQTLEEKKKEA